MAKAKIKNEVKELRKTIGMTQTELASKSGCSRQTIVMLEQERYVPSLSLAFTIAEALGVGIEKVFKPQP